MGFEGELIEKNGLNKTFSSKKYRLFSWKMVILERASGFERESLMKHG